MFASARLTIPKWLKINRKDASVEETSETMTNTVLIAEDYADARNLMRTLLVGMGQNVLTAADGQKAVDYATDVPPDLIIMDLSLPVMDGLVATRIIRANKKAAKVPIICVTAHSNYYQKMALEAGCNEVIAKPIDLDVLEAAIKKYITIEQIA